MPSPKSHRREEKNRMGGSRAIGEKARSFHGRSAGAVEEILVRPRTAPDLLSGRENRLTKLLLNVTVDRCLGEVRVVIAQDSTVGDLIVATLRIYKKEGRRPVLDGVEAGGFDLHYSQFSLESLDRDEKLITLGSRNFFLFQRRSTPATESNNSSGCDGSKSTSSCCNQAEKATNIAIPWLKFLF